MNFRIWNLRLGWFAFAFSLISYLLTVEPTASYWDCAEYISTSSKLQIGHPPGAPLFQMLGAFFSIFASDNEQISLMVNMMSVIASAITIFFLFLTLTIVGKKILIKESTKISSQNATAIITSSLIGSLSFTFSDSFWFNAVEAEVYAMATMIMSLLFWLGLKWEENMQKPDGNKWLVLISFIIGLSFGAKTNKMSQGHRGANHPVKNLFKNKVEITSQNHGYQIDLDSLPNCLEVTHTSLFDNSIEGIRHRSLPIFSVQYHPEASPGPTESSYLFNEFLNLIKETKNAKT